MEMSLIIQNRSHLKKWVTLVEKGHVQKKGVAPIKMG